MHATKLAHLKTSNLLQDEIEELWRKKHAIGERLKPWADATLQLSQDTDVAVKRLNQTLESVTATTEGPTSQKLVDIAQSTTAQSQEVLPSLVVALNALREQVETPPPQ